MLQRVANAFTAAGLIYKGTSRFSRPVWPDLALLKNLAIIFHTKINKSTFWAIAKWQLFKYTASASFGPTFVHTSVANIKHR